MCNLLHGFIGFVSNLSMDIDARELELCCFELAADEHITGYTEYGSPELW